MVEARGAFIAGTCHLCSTGVVTVDSLSDVVANVLEDGMHGVVQRKALIQVSKILRGPQREKRGAGEVSLAQRYKTLIWSMQCGNAHTDACNCSSAVSGVVGIGTDGGSASSRSYGSSSNDSEQLHDVVRIDRSE